MPAVPAAAHPHFLPKEAPMPEPFEAWFSRFESEFLRHTGTPWSQHQGELEEVLHYHTSGLSPEAAALDMLSASQPAPANL
jgi:hypothetical protein